MAEVLILPQVTSFQLIIGKQQTNIVWLNPQNLTLKQKGTGICCRNTEKTKGSQNDKYTGKKTKKNIVYAK